MKSYIKEHIYMAFGKSVKAKVKINSEDKVNEESLIFWALQYGRYVEILSPVETRNKIIKVIDDMKKQYHSSKKDTTAANRLWQPMPTSMASHRSRH